MPFAAERIVATGVQDQDSAPGTRNGFQHQLKTNGFVLKIAVDVEFGVNWNQPVHALSFDAMAGKIDERHFGSIRLGLEAAQRLPKLGNAELGASKGSRDKLGVVQWIGKHTSGALGGVTDEVSTSFGG